MCSSKLLLFMYFRRTGLLMHKCYKDRMHCCMVIFCLLFHNWCVHATAPKNNCQHSVSPSSSFPSSKEKDLHLVNFVLNESLCPHYIVELTEVFLGPACHSRVFISNFLYTYSNHYKCTRRTSIPVNYKDGVSTTLCSVIGLAQMLVAPIQWCFLP